MPGLPSFATRLLAWFDAHGRKDLPWQQQPTPYRVWVSEIMLQQTQVATVRGYYLRFMARFPDIASLAAASEDAVLAAWSGLGYYARARNLHAAAQRLVREHDGAFPGTLDQAMALPGIGRSTAAAILTLGGGQAHAILDGNVKRVLARHAAIDGWPGRRSVEARLWALAGQRLPARRAADYIQAMMDLGAKLCLPRQPRCPLCPVAADCQALGRGEVEAYPAPGPRKRLPVRSTVFLLARRRDGALLLERRPPSGIWGGLWCFPECGDDDASLEQALGARQLRGVARRSLPGLRHTFSHFHLDIAPVLVDVTGTARTARDAPGSGWFTGRERERVGLASAVVRLLDSVDALDR